MPRFSDDRSALDFVASRIAEEAHREGIPFSEIERKMLYFSETAWTLPDIWQISDEFDRDYDQDAYEKKVSQLIRREATRARKLQKEEFEAWTEAIARLSKHDRYLLVMLRQAGLRATGRSVRTHRWRLFDVCVVVAALLGGLVWLIGQRFPDTSVGRSGVPSTTYGSAVWAVLFGLAVLYSLLRFIVGAEKFDEFTDRVLEWIFGISPRTK